MTETVKTSKPSPEQTLFADNVLEIISPTVETFGFVRHRTEIENHFTTIIFRKDKQYIKINGSTYPTRYPYSYNLILGDGDSEDFSEWDWNSIAFVSSPFLVHFKSRIIVSLFNCLVIPAVGRSGAKA